MNPHISPTISEDNVHDLVEVLVSVLRSVEGEIVKVIEDVYLLTLHVRVKNGGDELVKVLDKLYRRYGDEIDFEDLRDESGIVTIHIGKIVGEDPFKRMYEEERDWMYEEIGRMEEKINNVEEVLGLIHDRIDEVIINSVPEDERKKIVQFFKAFGIDNKFVIVKDFYARLLRDLESILVPGAEAIVLEKDKKAVAEFLLQHIEKYVEPVLSRIVDIPNEVKQNAYVYEMYVAYIIRSIISYIELRIRNVPVEVALNVLPIGVVRKFMVI